MGIASQICSWVTGGSGALNVTGSGADLAGYDGSGLAQARTLNFNAANSNVIYGASNTVQPPALSLIPQVKY